METLNSSVDKLKQTFIDYIKATYHIADEAIIKQRDKILNTVGNVFQKSFIESTPQYEVGEKIENMGDLSQELRELLLSLSISDEENKKIIFNPLYSHQSKSIKEVIVNRKNVVIMTGTGSGKTESFLIPLLSKLFNECFNKPSEFRKPAVRSMILYPMNALVNDQLGRLRLIFGDKRLKKKFIELSNRPLKFGRYTGRTLYPGIRNKKKEENRLKSIEKFYIQIEKDSKENENEEAKLLLKELKRLGKWPSKEMMKWFGSGNWVDNQENFLRCNSLLEDAELFTRHEIQKTPPDLLVTNYHMLEYMLIRPIEKSIFDTSKNWLKENPDEKFLLILDEAHLYNGAGGAEVSLLIRRFTSRLGIDQSRMQIICSTASFSDPDNAKKFCAQLTGTNVSNFVTITGNIKFKSDTRVGSSEEVRILSKINLNKLQTIFDKNIWENELKEFFSFLGFESSNFNQKDLYQALVSYPVLNKIINTTMKESQPIDKFGSEIFPETNEKDRDLAISNLIGLATLCANEDGANLFPARVHNFFRGLPGLYVCMNPECNGLTDELKNNITGFLYNAEREACIHCQSRVLEYYTCRACGSSYARGYTDNVEDIKSLWAKEGEDFVFNGIETKKLQPVDIFLEKNPKEEHHDQVIYDLDTGRIAPNNADLTRSRKVYLPNIDHIQKNSRQLRKPNAQFMNCLSCGIERRSQNDNENDREPISPVEDHLTEGNQPFRALISKQLEIQPPSKNEINDFAPLQGRKVLAFSDSRQTAAKLAYNLQELGVMDVIRTLIAYGFKTFESKYPYLDTQIDLTDLNLALAVSCYDFNISLKPALEKGDQLNLSYSAKNFLKILESGNKDEIEEEVRYDVLKDFRVQIPESLLEKVFSTIFHYGHLSLEQLAIASVIETKKVRREIDRLIQSGNFPSITGIVDSHEEKREFIRFWLSLLVNSIKHPNMPDSWQKWRKKKYQLKTTSGNPKTLHHNDFFFKTTDQKNIFKNDWLPRLRELFCVKVDKVGDHYFILSSNVKFKFENNWMSCKSCKKIFVKRSIFKNCYFCKSKEIIELNTEEDLIFQDRKNFYRKPIVEASKEHSKFLLFNSQEHTSQTSSSDDRDLFSKAEFNELSFQDIDVSKYEGIDVASDVMSCTTTMEVGIDIGALSGVALRNMPPSRSNYQQRAGRAGRRGNALATVISYANFNNHDDYYYNNPEKLISGKVLNPFLTLDNEGIVRRHILAFLLQNYQQKMQITPNLSGEIFAHLGTVESFFKTNGELNFNDFKTWLSQNLNEIRSRLYWLPNELNESTRNSLLNDLETNAIKDLEETAYKSVSTIVGIDENSTEDQTQEDRLSDDVLKKHLLEHLNYSGKLPKYAMPNDVISFHVFDTRQEWVTKLKFRPSYSKRVALSAYAPDKLIYIDKQIFKSGAIYSVFEDERSNAWDERKFFYECRFCGHTEVRTEDFDEMAECNSCKQQNETRKSMPWLIPPGFAHPFHDEPLSRDAEFIETSMATKAKLSWSPDENDRWTLVNEKIKVIHKQDLLVITNSGPNQEGYIYCKECGLIEHEYQNTNSRILTPHHKPFPSKVQTQCWGGRNGNVVRNLVLGCDFLTDICLFNLKLNDESLTLKPGEYNTKIALRTICEALVKASCQILDISPDELVAEYRTALSSSGINGQEVEIFIYDTLPGGAGFAQKLTDETEKFLIKALEILKSCEGACDTSCYYCLQSFKNKDQHTLLDRFAGIELIEYLLKNEIPDLPEKRKKLAYNLLFFDLCRQDDDLEVSQNVEITINNNEIIAPLKVNKNGNLVLIFLSGSLSPDLPVEPKIRDIYLNEGISEYELIIVPELLVRKNLPKATEFINSKLE